MSSRKQQRNNAKRNANKAPRKSRPQPIRAHDPKRDIHRVRNNEIGPAVVVNGAVGYDIHPANGTLTPWLKNLANCYEQWRGSYTLTFRSSCATTTDGTLYMAIDRDPNDADPTTPSQIMVNGESKSRHIYNDFSVTVRDDRWRQTEFTDQGDTIQASNAQDVAIGKLVLMAETAATACGYIEVRYDIQFRYQSQVSPWNGSGGGLADVTEITSGAATTSAPLGAVTEELAGKVKVVSDSIVQSLDTGMKVVNYVYRQTAGSDWGSGADAAPLPVDSHVVELGFTESGASAGSDTAQSASATFAYMPNGTQVTGGAAPTNTYGGVEIDLNMPAGNSGYSAFTQLYANNPGLVTGALSATESAAVQHDAYASWAIRRDLHRLHRCVTRALAAKRRSTNIARDGEDLIIIRTRDGRAAHARISDGVLVSNAVLTGIPHDDSLAYTAFPRAANVRPPPPAHPSAASSSCVLTP